MRSDARERRPGVFVRPAARQRPAAPQAEEPSVAAAIDGLLAALDDGTALDRQSRPYGVAAARELRWWLGGHVREGLGTLPIGDLRRRDLEGLLDELADAGVSPRRLRELAKSMRALGDHTVDAGLLGHNPAERLAIPLPGDDAPPGGPAPDAGAIAARGAADRTVSFVLGLATLALMVVAVTFLAASL
jgi:hypothetical protein